jgi:DNA mismatch repair ATPase MutL
MLQKKQNIFLKNYLLTKNLMIKLLLREVEKLETLRLKEEYSVLLDEFIKRQQNEAQQNEAQQNEAQQNEAQQNEAQQNEAQQNEAQQNEAQQNEAQQNEAQQNEAQQNEAQQNEAQQNEAQQTFISEEDFINIELKKLNLKNLSKVDIFNSYPQIADKSLIISELENALDLTQADKESFLENQIQNEYLWGDFFSKISPLFNPYFVPKKNLSSFSILSIVKFKKKKK